MPLITIKTGVIGTNGKEEVLQEFICDRCLTDIATKVLGFVRGLGAYVVCEGCDRKILETKRIVE